MNPRGNSLAFSLVELSIVLVILGLLTGGILGGQALIRAAELRSVSTESQRYLAAINSFRDKYFALPGDMASATRFWGVSTACSGAAANGTCDGNGDGTLNIAATAGATGELFQFWRQQALAGLIEGNYSGLAGAGGVTDSVIGTNVPRSRLSNAGWAAFHFTGDASTYTADYGNILSLGAVNMNFTPSLPVLKPEEAWNIDTKVDDGLPGSGRVLTINQSGWFGGPGGTNTCTTSTSQTDRPGAYNLAASNVLCGLIFTRSF